MFYIYDIEGLQFRGPMEALEQNRRVEKTDAVKQLKFEDQLAQFSGGGPQAKAAEAYQRMIKRENMVEPLVHIHQIMSSPVSTISPNLLIAEAWTILKDSGIRQLVVTSEKKEVVGMVSDRDILHHLIIRDDAINVQHNLPVKEVIASEVITTDSMSDIRRVARVMAYYHIDAMPVLEEERLVGIVTRGDILRGFAENPKLNLWA